MILNRLHLLAILGAVAMLAGVLLTQADQKRVKLVKAAS
jgi:hypothetical protein